MRMIALLMTGLMVLSACNTVQGVARDVQGAAEVIEDGARKTKNAIVD